MSAESRASKRVPDSCESRRAAIACGTRSSPAVRSRMTPAKLERTTPSRGATTFVLDKGRFTTQNPAREARLAEVAELRAQGLPSLPSTLASELACNPFLRVDAPCVRASLAERGVDTGDRVASFAALRNWKDGFKG